MATSISWNNSLQSKLERLGNILKKFRRGLMKAEQKSQVGHSIEDAEQLAHYSKFTYHRKWQMWQDLWDTWLAAEKHTVAV